MENKIKVSEIFKSCQGEGRYTGYPMLFIRLSGCNRKCFYCDTKYHNEGKTMLINELVRIIKKEKPICVCWTGGEPLLWRRQIMEIRDKIKECYFHIETNGDLLKNEDFYRFHYLAISPKATETAKKVKKMASQFDGSLYDIKVVTDLQKTGKDLIKYATLLMPLTYTKNDIAIQKRVWEYCTKHNIKFSARLQYFLFGKKKGI